MSKRSKKDDECVRVVVRIRPLSNKEKQDGHFAIAQAFEDRGQIVVKNPKADEREPPKNFTFDAVFGSNCTQKQVYETCAFPVVEAVLDGFNGTIFAYGQTGAGKTFTMEGEPNPPTLRGIIPCSFQHIFDRVGLASDDQKFLVRASYLEIYNEEIRDLLSKDPKNRLQVKENVDSGVYVKDLTSFMVKNASEINDVMQAGKKNRSVGSTNMNAQSSRSHSIFTIIVECCQTNEQGSHIRVGKLNLVDLAGSERQSKTGATGDRLKEATKINMSLSALGNVISALVDGHSQHIPYRDSKLTRLLQDSLGGNTKTVMCANCGPAEYNFEETVTTLRYANRAKNIKNKPRINEDPKDAMLREFQEEIARLKQQLETGGYTGTDGEEMKNSGPGGTGSVREIIKEVHVEKIVGYSEEELKERLDKKEQDIKKRTQQQLKEMEQKRNLSDKEKQALEDRLRKEEEAKYEMEKKHVEMKKKVEMMEAKLIQGGEIMDKAAKQEAMLRKKQRELEEQKRIEETLARKALENEEAKLMMEEQYGTLEAEVESKTKKLKKLWNKFQTATREIEDLQEAFQVERSDMLDTIRELSRTIKLKDITLNNFIPTEEMRKIERRAKWHDEEETWMISRLEFTGNNLRPRRPVSATGLKRPESEYARHRKQYDNNPRYKYDNIINLELDMPDRTTQEYEGPDMVSRVSQILQMPMDAEGEELALHALDTKPQNPYLHYNPEEDRKDDRGKDSSRPKSGKKGKSSKSSEGKSSRSNNRPSTAGRRRRDDTEVVQSEYKNNDDIDEFKNDQEDFYPSARGLVAK